MKGALSMKTLVVYSSKYGSAAKYAALISGELGADLKKVTDVSPSLLADYGAVVFGGGLYAGSIRGADFVRRNAESLKGKRLTVFTVGMTDPANKKYYDRVIDRNFDAGIRINCRFFHLRGGLDLAALTPAHRALIGALRVFTRVGGETEEKRGMQKALSGADFFDASSVSPVVEFIKAP